MSVSVGPPPSVSLPTAASFARMEVLAGQKLHCVQFDIANAFYQMEMPLELRPNFCLPGLTGAQLGVMSVDGMLIGDSIVYPQFRAMPMGWSHALAWCRTLLLGLPSRRRRRCRSSRTTRRLPTSISRP